WGSPDAISDITVAAGWNIIDCSPDELAQDIRLVCNSDDNATAGCSHLENGSGAAGKIVRLPEDCGKNAFARVARAWIPDDQSIPEPIATKIVRRDGKRPQVIALTLDTNFNATDSSKTGPVNFAVQGANVKGAAGDIDISGVGSRRRRRGLTDFVGDAIGSIKDLDTFNSTSQTLPTFGVDKNITLFNKQLTCPLITASLTADMDAKANVVAVIGVAASGTIFPTNVEDFALIINMNGTINGTLTMTATASGTLEGKRNILTLGIPGLHFAGYVYGSLRLYSTLKTQNSIFTIGPTFEVDAQASAGLDLQADTSVGLNYNFNNAQLIFPPNSDQTNNAGNAFTIGDTPLQLFISPSVQATGIIQAHLIPSLNLKVSALGDAFNAGIFLNLDASAQMNLTIEAGDEASTTVDKKKREPLRTIGRYMPRDAIVAAEVLPTNVTSIVQSGIATSGTSSAACSSPSFASSSAPYSPAFSAVSSPSSFSFAPSSVSSASSTAVTPVQSSTGGDNASFGGYIQVDAVLSVNIGADGDLLKFSADTEVTLFNKTFELFQVSRTSSSSETLSLIV
ncbi:hypothetical protein C0992_005325, partial [Termitomyces sp. T32_za158]